MKALLLAAATATGLAAPAAASMPEMLAPVVGAVPQALAPVLEVDWSQLLTKTVIYQSLSTVLEAGLFVLVYGGGSGAAGTVALATAASAGAVYFVHEYVWESALAEDADRSDPFVVLGKTIAYRAVSTLRSVTWGGTLAAAGGAAVGFWGAFAVLDSALYALTDLAFAQWRPPAEMPPLPARPPS
jgi:hypothetical protein